MDPYSVVSAAVAKVERAEAVLEELAQRVKEARAAAREAKAELSLAVRISAEADRVRRSQRDAAI